MGLWLPPFGLRYLTTNLGATAAARDGTQVVASATPHAKGTWQSLGIDPIPEDVYAIWASFAVLSGSAAVTSCLVDIGAGPTGGGSEYVVVEDLNAWGAAGARVVLGRNYFLPVYIPAGERLSARCQALVVSETVQIAVSLYGAGSGAWGTEVPVMWERLGAVTNSNGVSVTPAIDGFGSWTTILDPVTKNYRWWHVGMDGLADTTQVAMDFLVEVGIGPDTSNVSTIGTWLFGTDAGEQLAGPVPDTPVYQPLPDDGLNGVFVRVASASTEARGFLVYAGE